MRTPLLKDRGRGFLLEIFLKQIAANILAHFIETGRQFRALRNYNGVMEIVGALNMTLITRLKQTWKVCRKH